MISLAASLFNDLSSRTFITSYVTTSRGSLQAGSCCLYNKLANETMAWRS